MFDRWLALWQSTTDRLLPMEIAKIMQAKAVRIAESLQLSLRFRHPSSQPEMHVSAGGNGSHAPDRPFHFKE